MFDKGIVVFSKAVCPNCDIVKKKLKAQGIDFVEVKLEDSPEALNMIKSKGYRSVPVVWKDGVDYKV